MEEEEKEVLLSKFKLLLGKYKGQQTAITEKDAQNAELRTKMQKLLAHCRTLQEQAGKQPDPTSSVEEGVKEREELAARLKCAENERDEAISKLADATGAAAGAGETDALASRLAASEAQAADEREALSASLAAQRQEYSAVVEERDVWKQKAVATEAQAKRLQEEREVLADTLAKTMEKNVSGEDDIGALQRRLEDNRAEKDAADQRLALVQEEMRAAAEAEYQAAAAQLEKTLEQRLGIAIEESRKECEALSIRMQEEAARSSALEEQIRMFEEKHESSRAVVAGEAEALASKLAAAEAQAAEEREVLSASLAEQKQSYGEVVEELEALKAEAQRAQEERQALADAEKEAADQRLAQVQEEVRAAAEAEYQAAAAQLEKTVEQRDGALEESRKECEALSIRMQEEAARSSALKEQTRMFEEKHESSRAAVAGEAEALASKLAAAEAQAAEEREVLSASLAEQKQSYGEVVEELEALKAEAQRAQEERQALADAEKEAADQRLAQVQEEVRAAAEAEYQAAAAQLEKTVEQRDGALEESRKECEALSIRMQEEAARSSALEEQIRMFEEKHEASRAVVAGEAEALASKLAAAEAQVLSAEARQGEHASVHARVVAEKDATASRLQEAGARLAALEAQQEQREARWALERTSTAETIGGLQDQLDTALAERASTSTHAEESVREMEERCAKALVDIRRDMEATIAAAEKERDAMALNLAQAEAQIKSEQDRAEDERETLSTALNEKAQMVAIVKEAEAAAEASRKECDTLTFRLQEETRVGSEKESNAVLEKETTASKLEEAEARCAERMEALATLTDEHAVISAKLSATEEDRDRRAQEATTLQEQLKNNADAFNKYRARARAALESTAESLQDSEARHAVLQERLDAQDKARLLTEGESKESSSKMARELESLLMSKEELLSRWLDTQTVHSKQEQVVAEHVRELCSVRQQLEEARSEVDDAQKEVKARGQRARKIISEREAVIKQLEQALKANSATERSAPSSVMPITSRKAHGQVEQELLQIARGQGQRDKETGRLKLLNSNLEEEVLEKRLVVEQQENLIMELEKKIEEIYQDVARREELNAVEKTTYLKNVLKRFVVCGDKERDSLLPVVFQMLRFSPEEIAEVRKNSVKTTGFLNAF